MQLRQTKALGIEDDHDRGVGDIDANLYHRRGDKNLCLATDKLPHLLLFILGFHLTMDLAHPKLRKDLFQ